MKLAKAGYGGGVPQDIANMDCDWVLKILQYENFCNDYEQELIELNRNG